MEEKLYGIGKINHLYSGDTFALLEYECLTLQEAEDIVADCEKKNLFPGTDSPVLAHNEYASPKYLIIPQDAWNRLDRWEMDQFDWDGVECQGLASGATDDVCGECKECLASMNEQLIDFAECAAKNANNNNEKE